MRSYCMLPQAWVFLKIPSSFVFSSCTLIPRLPGCKLSPTSNLIRFFSISVHLRSFLYFPFLLQQVILKILSITSCFISIYWAARDNMDVDRMVFLSCSQSCICSAVLFLLCTLHILHELFFYHFYDLP